MKLKNGSKKGFSVFTPMVGTAIVVITIMIASTIIQNDIRFSRAITSSYLLSSQTTVGRSVSTDIGSLMLSNMDNLLEESFENMHIKTSCAVSINCKSFAKDKIEQLLSADIDNRLPHILYVGVIESVETTGGASGYRINRVGTCSSNFDTCLSNTVSFIGGDLTEKEIEDDGYYHLSLNQQTLEQHKKDLALILRNDYTAEEFTISLIPEYGLAVKSDFDIDKCLEEAATDFDADAPNSGELIIHYCKDLKIEFTRT